MIIRFLFRLGKIYMINLILVLFFLLIILIIMFFLFRAEFSVAVYNQQPRIQSFYISVPVPEDKEYIVQYADDSTGTDSLVVFFSGCSVIRPSTSVNLSLSTRRALYSMQITV